VFPEARRGDLNYDWSLHLFCSAFKNTRNSFLRSVSLTAFCLRWTCIFGFEKDYHSITDQVKENEMARTCNTRVAEKYKQNFGRSLRERDRRRWTDSITVDLKGIGWEDVDWIYLA
jgi:hypothetical protein